MADRGREIFDQRVEYPMPARTGVRDYVFYFVPSSDGYGQGARYFFNRFYKHHVKHDVQSLEEMYATLHAAIGAGVTEIREIVIVAHGTTQGLIVPVFTAASDTNLREFRYTTPYSLIWLAADLADGKHASFQAHRSAAIAKLTTASFVTIRACRVGGSGDAMYALYALFGGRANVYAPRELQFFGSHPIAEGMRIDSRAKLHRHLVRQRFLPTDEHSTERQDALVEALLDPGAFSAVFDLAAAPVTGGAPADRATLDALIVALDTRKLRPEVTARFTAAGRTLTRDAVMKTIVAGNRWKVTDAIDHQGERFPVEYDVYLELGFPGSSSQEHEIVRATAQLVTVRSAREQVPIQLFFTETEDAMWKHKVLDLAGYPDSDPTTKPALDAVVALLDRRRVQDATLDLVPQFLAAGYELSSTATVSAGTTTGTGPLARRAWRIDDGTRHYRVKLQHPANSDGEISHAVSVYLELETKQRLAEEYAMMAYLGRAPDCPGPELAAYFDRFTRDELIAVVDHLRKGYRARNSYYIHHAQQAIDRKHDTNQWFFARYGDEIARQPLFENPYGELRGGERDDLRDLVYEFDFNASWAEVKASHPRLGTFTTDLLLDDDLAQKLLGTAPTPDRDGDVALEADSPYANLAELRALESQGLEDYFTIDKISAADRAAEEATECANFELAIRRLQALQATISDENQLRDRLEAELAPDGKTLLDHIKWAWGIKGLVTMPLQLKDMAFLTDGLVVRTLERIPWLAQTTFTYGESFIGPAVPLRLLPATPGVPMILMRVSPTIAIPFMLWKKFLDGQVEADQAWYGLGRRVGIREWLWRLIVLTNRSAPLGDIQIEIRTPGDTKAGRNAYFAEQRAKGDFTVLIFAPDKVEDGFDEGGRMMNGMRHEILDYANELLATALRSIAMEACHIRVLIDTGVLDVEALRKRFVQSIARELLKQV